MIQIFSRIKRLDRPGEKQTMTFLYSKQWKVHHTGMHSCLKSIPKVSKQVSVDPSDYRTDLFSAECIQLNQPRMESK